MYRPVRFSVVASLVASLTLAAPLTSMAAASKPIPKASADQITPVSAISGEYGPNVKRFANDLDAYWSRQLPKITKKPYKALKGYFAFDEEISPPECGGYIDYQFIAGNAFYCDLNDSISFDNQALFPSLYGGFGSISLGMVLAHEYGHAIQAQVGPKLTGVYAELQADCYSGAWLRHVSDGGSPYFVAEPGVVDDAMGAALTFRDRPGVSAQSRNAHGNGFDRAGSIQLGFDEGPSRCADYRLNPPVVTASTFRFVEEQANGGDVPLDQAITLAAESANKHFAKVRGFDPIARVERTDQRSVAALLDSCQNAFSLLRGRVSVCPQTKSTSSAATPSFLRVSDMLLADTFQQNGDVGASIVLVLGWATRVQQVLKQPLRDASSNAELRSTCLAGTWLGSEQLNSVLSPGDIDEALITLIQFSGKSSTFDRLRALRVGFTFPNKLSTCDRF